VAVGTGVDIVPVGRIAALVDRRGRLFLDRWFTAGEIAYCSAKPSPASYFAAQFAAKEAVFKALPILWDGPLPWRHIEIEHPECSPVSVRLSGDLAASATRAGVGTIHVTLTRSATQAMAVAIADRTLAVFERQ
jgi:holo-[acyl-carrier protein] synthase